MLRIEHIQCQHQGRTLLQVDNLFVASGELMGVLGPNGAGKSTLLKAISGERRTTGRISFHGRALEQWQPTALARHLAVLPQSSQLTFAFRAREVVALGLTPLRLNRRQSEQAIRQVMTETDCWQLADRDYPTLSGGERQRVQLARVLLQLSQAEQAPLLLLDEPTAAQDLGQQHRLLQLATALCHQRDFAVVAILHDLNQVLRYCSRACLLNGGRLVGEGTPEALLDVATVEKHWQYRPERVALGNGGIAVL